MPLTPEAYAANVLAEFPGAAPEARLFFISSWRKGTLPNLPAAYVLRVLDVLAGTPAPGLISAATAAHANLLDYEVFLQASDEDGDAASSIEMNREVYQALAAALTEARG